MYTLVKSDLDGHWYYEYTVWKYVLDYVVDALASFSEADLLHPIYSQLNSIADEVSFIIEKEKSK